MRDIRFANGVRFLAVLFGVAAYVSARTSPLAPIAAGPTVIGIVSDLNGTECQTLYPKTSIVAFENLLRQAPAHILLPGDLVHGECLTYRGDKPYTEVTRDMWKSFETHFFAKIPNGTSVTAAPGNHDAPYLTAASRTTFRNENAAFVDFWRQKEFSLGVTPLHVEGTEDNYPYSWAYLKDDLLFVTLQSTRTGTLSDAVRQKAWLRTVLASSAARTARARIVYGHVPPYPVLNPDVGSKYGEILKGEQIGQKDSLMDLLLDHHVDLFVGAHSHAPYPGELVRRRDGQRMKIVSTPCGHAPRKLNSHASLAPRGYVVVKVAVDGRIDVSVKSWEKGEEVPFDYFPSRIDLQDERVDYRRVAPANYR